MFGPYACCWRKEAQPSAEPRQAKETTGRGVRVSSVRLHGRSVGPLSRPCSLATRRTCTRTVTAPLRLLPRPLLP